MSDIKKELKRLKNLIQFKKKPDSILEIMAQMNVWKKQIDIASKFTNTEEKKLAEKSFESYTENYTFQSYEQITRLSDLIYNEILLNRAHKNLNEISDDKNSKFLPDKIIQSAFLIENRINELKLDLGIVKKGKKTDDLTALQEIIQKFKIKIAFERNEFEVEIPFVCKKCGHEDVEMYLLRRRCNKENFEVFKHPAFLGRWLYNIEIMNDVKADKITKEMAARYQRTSPRMISYMIENEHKIIQIDNVTKEDINSFVNKNPFLRSADEYNEKNIKKGIKK